MVREVDNLLASITLPDCADSQLLDLLDECVAILERLHHDEVLAATLLPKVTRTAAAVALDVLARHAAKIDGIKISLLSKEKEIAMRRRLPPGVRMYTGDEIGRAHV